MSYILTFCTADVQPALIKKLIKDSLRVEYTVKTWSIVCFPDQTNLGKPTKTTIKPFQTGFKNASQEELANFVRSQPEQTGPYEFSPENFAILDKRSIRDNTILLSTYVEYMPEELKEEGWIEEKVIREWRDFRVEFTIASYVASILLNMPFTLTHELDANNDAYVDENGILRLEEAPMKEGELEEGSDSAESDE